MTKCRKCGKELKKGNDILFKSIVHTTEELLYRVGWSSIGTTKLIKIGEKKGYDVKRANFVCAHCRSKIKLTSELLRKILKWPKEKI